MRFAWCVLVALVGCGGAAAREPSVAPQGSAAPSGSPSPSGSVVPSGSACGAGEMVVRFYDVGQGLSALVDLPDGRHVLVDTGDEKGRAGCGEVCGRAAAHLDEMLARDLHGAPIDLVWITHQHSDHVGGAPAVLSRFPVRGFADNGRDLEHAEIKNAHASAVRAGAKIFSVDPEHPVVPLEPGNAALKLTAVVPAAWPSRCKSDQNDCSIMLRIDWCSSSVLFTGDAEHDLEKVSDTHGPVTLLQVGHHGSNTSSSEAFLARAAPRYAVISSGKPHEGLNAGYCHPRASAVRRLSEHLTRANGSALVPLRAYDRDDKCDDHDTAAWADVQASSSIYSTARDGDVVLVTKGDGVFTRRANLAH